MGWEGCEWVGRAVGCEWVGRAVGCEWVGRTVGVSGLGGLWDVSGLGGLCSVSCVSVCVRVRVRGCGWVWVCLTDTISVFNWYQRLVQNVGSPPGCSGSMSKYGHLDPVYTHIDLHILTRAAFNPAPRYCDFLKPLACACFTCTSVGAILL